MEARTHRDTAQKVYDAFRNVFGTIAGSIQEVEISEVKVKLEAGIAPDWRAKADEVLGRLAACEKPVVLLIDELPVLVAALLFGAEHRMTPERVERARVFLSWLREATIHHRGKIRFVVSGSIGLEPLLSRAGINATLTTFTPLEIGPWQRPTASDYILDRAKRSGLTLAPEATDRLVDRLGYLIPHHVAMFMHFVRLDAQRRNSTSCTPDDIDRIYERHMLSVRGHLDLATYEDRLKTVVDPEILRVALELLTEAAVAGRLTAAAAMTIFRRQGFAGPEAIDNLRFLLNVFVHDGYLKQVGNDYVFVLHLLRDWWRNRFSFGHVCAETGAGGSAQ
jgi:hypothetical protein